MKLYQLLTSERIRLGIAAKSRDEVIVQLVNLLASETIITDPETVTAQLLERERQVGTGVGFGVAIPHADPGPYSEPALAFARLTEKLNFNAPDGGGADLVFLLLTPDKTPALHVRLLARMCRLIRSAGLRNMLLTAETPEEVIAGICAVEADFPELNP